MKGTSNVLAPNAGAQPLPEAGATQERTLEAVGCSAWLGSLFRSPDLRVQRDEAHGIHLEFSHELSPALSYR